MNKPLPTEAAVMTKFLQHISLATQGLETLLSNQRDHIQVPDKGPCSSRSGGRLRGGIKWLLSQHSAS